MLAQQTCRRLGGIGQRVFGVLRRNDLGVRHAGEIVAQPLLALGAVGGLFGDVDQPDADLRRGDEAGHRRFACGASGGAVVRADEQCHGIRVHGAVDRYDLDTARCCLVDGCGVALPVDRRQHDRVRAVLHRLPDQLVLRGMILLTVRTGERDLCGVGGRRRLHTALHAVPKVGVRRLGDHGHAHAIVRLAAAGQ